MLTLSLSAVLVARVGAAVTEADFDVPADQVDATVERLAAVDFAEVARPAAAILARREPKSAPAGRDPRLTDAEHEARRRRFEEPAFTVARLVWDARTTPAEADPGSVLPVLGKIAGDFRTEPEVRRVAIKTLARGASGRGDLTDGHRTPLYHVAVNGVDDAALRCLAAQALMREPSAMRHDGYDNLLGDLPGIVRAQPTLAERHAAFNDITNIGKRLHRLPAIHFAALVRVGFELIDETPADTFAGAYGTAHQLGYMLKREFMPPQGQHGDAAGNLGKSFYLETVVNARRWWTETGRAAMDAILPLNDVAPRG